MATIATLIALTAVLYLIVRYESSPRMEPIRVRDDEEALRRRHQRRR